MALTDYQYVSVLPRLTAQIGSEIRYTKGEESPVNNLTRPLQVFRDHMKTWPGRPYPLGATWDGRGANFALFSENATAVELCLFSSEDPKRQTGVIRLTEQTNHVWHAYL